MNPKQEASPQPTLLFIPDISGFTNFIHKTEVIHSQHIIEELLEVLIDANEIGLQISEIEGDAILFYRTGRTPTAAELLAQVQKMYEKFHSHLKKYESQRICQCGACSGTRDLGLKFIVHYGDISNKQVKSYSKLFGSDLIVAHRLMKNEINLQEYVLVTHQLLNACASWVEMEQVAWESPQQGEENYDFGQVKYCYLSMEPLRALIPEPVVKDYAISDKMTQNLEVENVLNAPLEMVFDVASDVRAKHLWMMTVKRSDKLNGKIVRNGSTHRCIMNNDENDPFFTSHGFKVDQDLITWTDSNYSQKWSLVLTLRRIGSQLTRVNVTVLAKHTVLTKIYFDLFEKKKHIQFFGGSLEKLNSYCQDLMSEGKSHSTEILLEPADAHALTPGV